MCSQTLPVAPPYQWTCDTAQMQADRRERTTLPFLAARTEQQKTEIIRSLDKKRFLHKGRLGYFEPMPRRDTCLGDTLLEMKTRGNTEEESCMDEERASQPRKKLSHSIEEILSRPICVRKEKRFHRDWSVIKENTGISNQLSQTGMFFHYSF